MDVEAHEEIQAPTVCTSSEHPAVSKIDTELPQMCSHEATEVNETLSTPIESTDPTVPDNQSVLAVRDHKIAEFAHPNSGDTDRVPVLEAHEDFLSESAQTIPQEGSPVQPHPTEETPADRLSDMPVIKSSSQADPLRVQQLENNILALQKNLTESNEKVQQREIEIKRTVANLQAEMRLRLDQSSRVAEEAKKEKESMVLKFAQAEQRNMESQKKCRELENKVKECQKERDSILARARNLKAEKEKLQSQLDSRCTDYATFEKEMQTLKEIVATSEQKLKWHQARLQEEQERSRQLRSQHDECAKKLVAAREEADELRHLCTEIVAQHGDAQSQEASTPASDVMTQLRTTLDEVKQRKVLMVEQEQQVMKLNKEVDQFKKQLQESVKENKAFREKCTVQEADRLCKEELLNSTKLSLKQLKATHEQTVERLRQLEPLEKEVVQLRTNKEKLNQDYDNLLEAKRDLEQELESLRRKESELLEFTQRLSDRNASLQAENLNFRSHKETLTNERDELRRNIEQARVDLDGARQALEEERRVWLVKRNELEAQLAEKTRSEAQLQQSLNDERNEIRALTKKHTAQRKDLSRQVNQLRRHLEQLGATTDASERNHNNTLSSSIDADTVSQHSNEFASPTSASVPHLKRLTTEINSPATSAACDPPVSRLHSPYEEDSRFIVKMVEPDKQTLIEKIVHLQKSNAMLTEKLDFFREHTAQLTEELRKKHKLLQAYFLRDESGSLSPEHYDRYHHMMAQKGGIMASLYNSHSSDGNMSLDLSLEINKKLQGLLEDSMLKNIMLKENISTLGEEIGRLNSENQRLQQRTDSAS